MTERTRRGLVVLCAVLAAMWLMLLGAAITGVAIGMSSDY